MRSRNPGPKVDKGMDPVVDILIERSRARRLLRLALPKITSGRLAAEIIAFLAETEAKPR